MTEIWPLVWRETIDSTNEEAKRLAKTGGFSDQWIAAREQTAGRGRLSREWKSAPGNLYCTALFHEPFGMAAAARVPFVGALAVSDALGSYAPDADIRLKWPNDVRCGGAKLCGILIEAGAGDADTWVAAGIGINIASVPDGAGQTATCLVDLRGDGAVTADMVAASLQTAFAERLAQARDDFAATIDAWLARAEGLGQMVRVSPGRAVIEGVFEGLEPDGALILSLPDGERRVIRAGDVELIKEIR